MPGPAPKPAERRQRRNKRPQIEVHEGGGRIVSVPDPPAGLLEQTVADWESYWCSDLASVVEQDTDMPAIRRLFQLYDERERAHQAYRQNRIVKGSQGQPTLHPMARREDKLNSEIRQMEDRLGLTPRSRLQLGIQLTEARKGLSELMDGLEPEYGDGD